MTFRNAKLRLRLEHAGTCVRECLADEMPGEALVGRADDCFWKVPESDKSVSSHHAVIRRRHGAWVLRDTDSRNGVYFRGRAVAERRLSAGDVLSLGESRIVVEDASRQEGAPVAEHHVLEQLSGEGKSATIPLEKDVTRVGSGRECEIRIADSLVSHVHALFEVRADGYCYVKDNGSRNGIRVNGVRQTEEAALTGQMLKDGDVVSVAYVDFRFWDRHVRHVRAGLSRKLLVVVATLAIAIGGYFGVLSFFPTARDLRLKAESAAAAENFERADALLRDSAQARGAELDAVQRGDLAQRLKLWRTTAAGWASVRHELSSGNPDLWQANVKIAGLLGSDNENWSWNTENAVREMKCAKATHAVLSKYLTLVEKLGDAEADVTAFAALAADARRVVATADCEASYVVPLRARLADVAEELGATAEDADDLRGAFDGYGAVEKTDGTREAVERVLRRNHERIDARQARGRPTTQVVQRMGRRLLEPLVGLQTALRQYESNCLFIARLEFDRLRQNLDLPRPEACMGAASLTSRREDLMRENALLLKMSVQLKSYQAYLKSQGLLEGTPGNASLAEFFDAEKRASAIACDCLGAPPPSYSQKKAESAYDSLLGVNVFFAYLSALTDDFDASAFDDRFKPTLFVSADVFRSVEQFVRFCDPSSASAYGRQIRQVLARAETPDGGLAGEIAKMKGLLGRRDAVVKELKDIRARNAETRTGVLAGGIVVALAPTAQTPEDEKYRQELAADFARIRRRTADVLRRAEGKGPEIVREAEAEALRIGIPGDTLLKQPWADRTRTGK